jgi:hypothetical protein
MDLRYTNPAVYEAHIDDMVDFIETEELEQQGVPLNQRSREIIDYVRAEIGRERIDDAIEDWRTTVQ